VGMGEGQGQRTDLIGKVDTGSNAEDWATHLYGFVVSEGGGES